MFAPPATLTFTYAPAEIGNAPPLGLRIGYATGSTWSAIPSTVDSAQHKVSARSPTSPRTVCSDLTQAAMRGAWWVPWPMGAPEMGAAAWRSACRST